MRTLLISSNLFIWVIGVILGLVFCANADTTPNAKQKKNKQMYLVRSCENGDLILKDKQTLTTDEIISIERDEKYSEQVQRDCIFGLTEGLVISKSEIEQFKNKISIYRKKLQANEESKAITLKHTDPYLYLALQPGLMGPLDTYLNMDVHFPRFLMELSDLIYYDEKFDQNPNNSSMKYTERVLMLDNDIKRISDELDSTQELLDQYKTMLKKSTSTSSYIDITGDGSIKIKTDDGKTIKMPSPRSCSQSTKVDDCKEPEERKTSMVSGESLKSIAPEIFEALKSEVRTRYNEDVNDSDSILALFDMLYTKLYSFRIQLAVVRDDRMRLNDPNLRAFYAKLETRHYYDEFEKYTPVGVLYRNVKVGNIGPLTRIMQTVKGNPEIDTQGKELSGIVLFKEGEPDNEGHIEDQILLVFSGSNSAQDWVQNLNCLQDRATGIASGLIAHRGFVDIAQGSIKEAGTNISWLINKYRALVAKRKNIAVPGSVNLTPTLRFITTGHSLGGALAVVFAAWGKTELDNKLKKLADTRYEAYTFAGPPVFDKRSSKEVNNLIDKVFRFLIPGDPVANLSVLKTIYGEKFNNQSMVEKLLGFVHVGVPVPLLDVENILTPFEKYVDIWALHRSPTYIDIIANLFGNGPADKNNRFFSSLKKAKQMVTYQNLENIENFIAYEEDRAVTLIDDFDISDIKNAIEKDGSIVEEKYESIIKNYGKIKEQLISKGISGEITFTSRDDSEVTYNHNLSGSNVNFAISHGTSCKIENLSVENKSWWPWGEDTLKFNYKSFTQNERDEVTCTCCLVKHAFTWIVPMYNPLAWNNYKGSSVQSILDTCSEDKCSAYFTNVLDKRSKQDPIGKIGSMMKKVGLKEKWDNKKLVLPTR
ncbi:MAG: lipase family protein [Oligoflexia bacterium]|nr:lipase family protein [Oligoflexia bacterium]